MTRNSAIGIGGLLVILVCGIGITSSVAQQFPPRRPEPPPPSQTIDPRFYQPPYLPPRIKKETTRNQK